MMSYIYTRRREPKSIFYTSLLPNSERQEGVLWLICGALVAQGGPGTFGRYLRTQGLFWLPWRIILVGQGNCPGWLGESN